jgi:hypothetical protein
MNITAEKYAAPYDSAEIHAPALLLPTVKLVIPPFDDFKFKMPIATKTATYISITSQIENSLLIYFFSNLSKITLHHNTVKYKKSLY